jgi:hypothetical protein
LETDVVMIQAALRVLVATNETGTGAVAGLAAGVHSRIQVLSGLALRPSFEAGWLGPRWTARLANQLLLTSGNWRIGLTGGAQVWAHDTELLPGVGGALSVGWRHEAGRTAIEVTAAVALARDPSFLLDQPIVSTPRAELAPWVAVSIAVLGPRRPGTLEDSRSKPQ